MVASQVIKEEVLAMEPPIQGHLRLPVQTIQATDIVKIVIPRPHLFGALATGTVLGIIQEVRKPVNSVVPIIIKMVEKSQKLNMIVLTKEPSIVAQDPLRSPRR
jgi:hypothetical protein